MGGASVPALAAAVSNAGGLGVLGAAACSPERLRSWIRETRALTDKPFGVDTLLPASVRRGKAPETGAAPADPMAVFGEYQQFRSEEHTSELQSLMRISYAVFCLQTKTTQESTKLIPPTHSTTQIPYIK